jgi:hypothetical protein
VCARLQIDERTHLSDPGQRDAGGHELVRRGAELLDLGGREAMRPFLRVIAVVLGLPDRRARDLLGELLERLNQVGQRLMLTGRLEAVGEELDVDGSLSLSLSLSLNSELVRSSR